MLNVVLKEWAESDREGIEALCDADFRNVVQKDAPWLSAAVACLFTVEDMQNMHEGASFYEEIQLA